MRPTRFGLTALGAVLAGALVLGLAATAAAADQGPPIKPEAREAGRKAAPALMQAAGIPCQVSDARLIGVAPDPKTKKDTKYYEIACTGGLGYDVVDTGTTSPSWASCADQAKVGADGKPNQLYCILPGDADASPAFDAYVAKTKAACDVSGYRGIGHSPESSYFEVACKNGRGYILKTSSPPDPAKPAQLITCLAFAAGSQLECKLTQSTAQLGVIDALASQSGKNCQVKDKRYILTSDAMDNYYEVACTDGKGYVLHEDASGKLAEVIGCDVAGGIGGGCTLTSGRAAETQQAGLYSTLAHKAGFACDVSKYSPFNVDMPGHEVVELACSNRPDGAVAVFPAKAAEAAQIFDCAHSELAGFRCSFTKADDAFPRLTDDLRKLGKTSCAVNGERMVGETADKTGYIEVTCADGNPGYMVSYAVATMAPKEAIACTLAKDVVGGCTLPGNSKR